MPDSMTAAAARWVTGVLSTRRRVTPGKAFAVTGVIAVVTVLGGCGSSPTSPAVSMTAGPTAATAPDSGAELDATGFAAALKIPTTVVLDVRTPEEFDSGHLPGAVNIDLNGDDFAGQVSQLDRGVPYAVYCRSGSRSAEAVRVMKSMDFNMTFHLAGGMSSWKSARGEIVTGS